MKSILLPLFFLGSGAFANETLSVGEAISKLKDSGKKSMSVSVTGEVSSVCQSMGCWITIKPEGAKVQSKNICEESLASASTQADVRVMMGKHSFTVPKDLKGKVTVVGKLKKKKLSSFQLKHLLKDAGCDESQMKKAKKAIYKYQIVASKVLKGDKVYSKN